MLPVTEMVELAFAMLKVIVAAVPLPPVFEARMETVVPLPAALGVPVIEPVVALRLSPVGSVPLVVANPVGVPPVVASAWLKAVPTVPL